jgi:F0F1-type ATP synthase assembly protein I
LSKKKEGMQPQGLTPQKNAAIIRALSEVDANEKAQARTVVALQMIVVLVATIVISIAWMPDIALAVLSGGVVSVLNGTLLAWRMSKIASASDRDAQLQLRLLYFYAAERFMVVIVSLAFCMAALRLTPFAVLGGFVMGQAVLLTARLFLRIKTEMAAKNG